MNVGSMAPAVAHGRQGDPPRPRGGESRVRAGIGVMAMLFCAAIYFEVNRHYWFFDWSGFAYDQKFNLYFLGGLFVLAGLHVLPPRPPSRSWVKTAPGSRFVAMIATFLCAGGMSVFLNEPGWDEIQRYIFYLYTPVFVLVSVVILHPSDRTIRRTLMGLFTMGSLFCVYSMLLHMRLWAGEDLSAVYRSPAGVTTENLSRRSVPGLGANMLPSMLVPMVLTGLYFSQRGTGWVRAAAVAATGFLILNLLILASRGAMVALAVAMIFLCVKRWFRFNSGFVLLGAVSLAAFAGYGDFVLARFEQSVMVRGVEEGVDGFERLVTIRDSLSFYFANHPISGAGFTYFDESQGPRIAMTDHNVYAQLLAQGGLLVGIPFALMLIMIHRHAGRILRSRSGNREALDLGTILAAGFIAFLVDLNFSVGLLHYNAVWWGLVVAWTRNQQLHLMAAPGSLPMPGMIPRGFPGRSRPAASAAYGR